MAVKLYERDGNGAPGHSHAVRAVGLEPRCCHVGAVDDDDGRWAKRAAHALPEGLRRASDLEGCCSCAGCVLWMGVFHECAAVRTMRLASVHALITPLAVFQGFLSAGALLYRRGRAPRAHAGVNSAWHLQEDTPTFKVRMQGRLGARAWCACVLAGDSLPSAGPCAPRTRVT